MICNNHPSVWVCNECGSQEFTGNVSEDDLDYLACINCGCDEFHREYLDEPVVEKQKELQRLVVITHYSDDCTYSFDETVPIEYESAEAFIVDFEEAAKKAMKNWPMTIFFIANKDWEASEFFRGDKFEAPKILTLDEWYANGN